MIAGPVIYFPRAPGEAPEVGGTWAHLSTVLHVEPRVMAAAVGLELSTYLEAVERWADVDGFTYGVRVDREAGTITQAGGS
jgi:hypothetical protein